MSNSSSTMIPIGVRFMVLSAFGFALMSATVKHVGQYGLPVFEIVAARALVSLVISYLDVKRKRISIWGNNKRLLLTRGAVGTVALICVYYSVTTLPLAEATIFQYIHPAFTALLAVFFLKERIQPSTFICIALCLLGVYVMIRPETGSSAENLLPTLSVAAAITGALCSSVAYVIVRKLSQTEDSSVIIFYFPLVALPASILLMGDNFVMPDLYLTVMLVLIGIFTQIGQLGMTKAMQTQEAGKASAYSYIQIIFSGLIGIVIFNELPSVWTYIGAGLIVTGALINAFGRHLRLPFVRRSAS